MSKVTMAPLAGELTQQGERSESGVSPDFDDPLGAGDLDQSCEQSVVLARPHVGPPRPLPDPVADRVHRDVPRRRDRLLSDIEQAIGRPRRFIIERRNRRWLNVARRDSVGHGVS